ncbi:hypothetical protein [Mesorhizobium erdmanii]|uniref:Uncharacterized protein n=1 Tax=Mesorhizobium erdmanii TaxID=1777866 RepID=A0A6M7UIW3_9HYPH|nr:MULTISPECIES: hypothetical protein [Mesorhizobium]OBQ70114.1 hypothetical protein A8146_28315 [Mesorhizobium loti]QKC76108.1 hypothetical protein EB233_11620 [Mesorhizobium erdmanii]
MDEIVPVILGAVLGVLVWCTSVGWMRSVLAVLAILAAGIFATILSGEIQLSWLYFLIDFSEAGLGLVIGIALVRYFRRSWTANTSVRN